jgi:hypothetical protein
MPCGAAASPRPKGQREGAQSGGCSSSKNRQQTNELVLTHEFPAERTNNGCKHGAHCPSGPGRDPHRRVAQG